MIAHDGTDVWPTHGAPTLREIGIGLGRAARFGGQTRDYYNVLAHSIVCASLTPLEHRHHALLHDAHEAILGDVVTTWKDREREIAETRLQRRIYESLGLAEPGAEAYLAVRGADRACLIAEAHILGHAKAEHYWPIKDADKGAMAATRYQLAFCRDYLNANTAAGIFVNRYHIIRRQQELASDPTPPMPETFLEAAAQARAAT